jgi:hypothetical protein
MLSLLEEINFWTGIMSNHGEFILTSLSYNEQEALNYAEFYKQEFSKLHEKSKIKTGDSGTVNSIFDEYINLLTNFVNFKKYLLGKSLSCQLNSSLPPTFYNHMINEAVESYKTITELASNTSKNTTLETLELHKVWLPDAAGHAATIACDLDPLEKSLINEAKKFEKDFNSLSMKTQELEKMLERTGLNDGALARLDEEAKAKITDFIAYLDKIKDLSLSCKVLGTLKPLIPDHMMREENYYLYKIMSLQ